MGTQNGCASREVVLTCGGIVQISARAGNAVSTETIALRVNGATPVAVLPLPTNPVSATTVVSDTLAPMLIVAEATAPAAEPTEEASMSLVVALLTMVVTISLLLVVQVRVLPRQTLVHSMLWAMNCGLGAYILYGLGLMPGGNWLHGSLRVWGTGLVVFIAMLLPLVVLQLRPTE